MEQHYTMMIRISLAILAGGIIGLERAHHGRPAGLRTHTLVCVSSCLLMLLTEFQWELFADRPPESLRVDPTRMGQGIMTGIGFLGAGVIMKEKFTIRGLTTAGSIWMTASIGIIIGIGMLFAAFFTTVVTLIVLSMFGWIEKVIPTMHYGKLMMKFKSSEAISKDLVMELIGQCEVKSFAPSYLQDEEGRYFRYEMTVRTNDINNFYRLSEVLRTMDEVQEYTVMPTGD